VLLIASGGLVAAGLGEAAADDRPDRQRGRLHRDRAARSRRRPYVERAAQRGLFAYLVDGDPAKLQSALEVTLRRFAEFHNLQGAFGRRSVIERAKGILMERHQIGEEAAFDLLRDQGRSTSRKLSDIAVAVVDGYRLLPPYKGLTE
jgi:AmiR/NasT family two-component response regulator